jgi:hypothetical protein
MNESTKLAGLAALGCTKSAERLTKIVKGQEAMPPKAYRIKDEFEHAR